MWRLMCVTLVLILCVKDSLSQLNVCGHAPLNPRIMGGADAAAGSWPWMVSLYNTNKKEHFCGGSLINKEWVLTAAHCVFGESKATLLLYLGKRNRDKENKPNEITKTVDDIVVHPAYHDNDFDNDIALLHLSSQVKFNDYIQPVCLAAQSSNFPSDTKGWVTGWGHIQYNTPLPPPGILREVEVEVYDDNHCRNLCHVTITNNMICAGTQQGGKGAGQGDSGGPLVHKKSSQWVQSGVVNLLEGCALPDLPDVYTRVSVYQQWITDHTGQNPPGFVVF